MEVAYRCVEIVGNEIRVKSFEKAPPKKPFIVKKRKSNPFKLRSYRSAVRSCKSFRDLILANSIGDLPLLITLTYAKNEQNLDKGWYDYSLFLRKMRKVYGRKCRFICVPEYQKRGAIHFHVLAWGLPRFTDVAHKITFFLQKKFWFQGFVFTRKCYSASNKLANYLSKYLMKTIYDKRAWGKKTYSSSGPIYRKTKISGEQYAYLREKRIFGVVRRKESCEFDTKYLGRCRVDYLERVVVDKK